MPLLTRVTFPGPLNVEGESTDIVAVVAVRTAVIVAVWRTA